MTRARSNLRIGLARLGAALLAAITAALPLAARAEYIVDPSAIYAQMKQIYDQGAAHGWKFADQLTYQSYVLDAGRAYALRHSTDPTYKEMLDLTVDVATLLHYDPLINDDAAEWYVRLACAGVADDPTDTRQAAAKALLAKLDAEDDDPKVLAHDATADSQANAHVWTADPDALVALVVADLRAYHLAKDERYRSLALEHAAQASFPITALDNPEATEIYVIAQNTVDAQMGTNPKDREIARIFLSHRNAVKSLIVIGRVKSSSAERRLVITAPADEYFGRTKLSPIGVANETIRIGKYLDAGWGDRMTSDGVYLADSIDDWQKQYPRDYAMPRTLLAGYNVVLRIGSPAARAAADKLRNVLLVQYSESAEARALLGITI
jgi:predicted nucleic acid-binding protein